MPPGYVNELQPSIAKFASITACARGRKRHHVLTEHSVVPGPRGMAVGYGARRYRAPRRGHVSCRTTLCARRADSTLVDFDSEQHRRGTCPAWDAHVSSTRSDRVGFARRTRHSVGSGVATEVDWPAATGRHRIRAQTLPTVVARPPAFAHIADDRSRNRDGWRRRKRVAHSIRSCMRTALRTSDPEPRTPNPGSRIPAVKE